MRNKNSNTSEQDEKFRIHSYARAIVSLFSFFKFILNYHKISFFLFALSFADHLQANAENEKIEEEEENK